MSHIFISYSKKNRDYARQLADFLELQGFNVWIDDRIDYGDSWERVIFKAIDECAAFVVIMTPQSYESDWVLRECRHAEKRNKPPFPVLLDGEEFPRYGITQYVDVHGGKMPPHDFVARLGQVAPRSPVKGQNIAPPPKATSPLTAKEPRVQGGESVGVQFIAPTPPKPLTSEEIRQMWNTATRKILGNDNLFKWCLIPSHVITREPDLDDVNPMTGTPYGVDYGPMYSVVEHTNSFFLSKYPITYAQFQPFLDDPQGFKNPQWWKHLAADADHKKQWGDQVRKIANHPREMVSWYDGIAFCRWLSFKLWALTPPPSPPSRPLGTTLPATPSGGGGANSPSLAKGKGLGDGVVLAQDYNALDPDTWLVRLPTEAEWQRAAQGDDGRAYPWGNEFDQTYCNTEESGIRKTTPVTQYPQGASPYGMLDMSGNVWEWCLTEYVNSDNRNMTNSNMRVLRGGSWLDGSDDARSVSRNNFIPFDRYDIIGFRVLLHVSLLES